MDSGEVKNHQRQPSYMTEPSNMTGYIIKAFAGLARTKMDLKSAVI
jgi:hypothetical protein